MDFSGPGSSWAGGPSERRKIYASSLREHDSLISSYEHLSGVPNPEEALKRLRKIASLVKPIMRKRDWKVTVLTEFLPEDARLLGLNINHGYKICIRLRYSHDPSTFLPFEHTVDTMLHELSHIIFGPHDAPFHALWDELREEHETLLFKGYTGEGFLSKGNRLGGGRVPPAHELRRMARQSAEKRRVLTKNSGQRLGGRGLATGQDPRRVIADNIERRNAVDKGCASGSADAGRLAQQASRNVFKTKGELDDANDRAIAEALLELMEEEENRKLEGTYATLPAGGGLTWTPEGGLATEVGQKPPVHRADSPTEEEQLEWALRESTKPADVTKAPQATPQATQLPTMPGPGFSSHRKTNWKPVAGLVQDAVNKSHKRPRPINSPLSSPGYQRAQPRTSMDDPSKLAHALTAANPPYLERSRTNSPTTDVGSHAVKTTSEPDSWVCEICTCINPLLYLSCDACGVERPPKVSQRTAAASLQKIERDVQRLAPPPTMGWNCRQCCTFMEHKWWSCSHCGLMKASSEASEHV